MNSFKAISRPAILVAGVLCACTASAQYGYGNPSTGAGSTSQPSRQYQQMQQDAQRRANTYYYQPAPPAPTQQQMQQQYTDAANAWKPMGKCIGGAVLGSFSGPVGMVGGCAASAAGVSKFQSVKRLFSAEQAY